MIRTKKESRRIFFTLLFISIISISNLLIIANFNNFQENNILNTDEHKELDKAPQNSILNINEEISGNGTNQDVRIYVNNQSENLNDNMNYFNISTNSANDMFLTYGNFNFTFQNNYTTEYVLEDKDALYPQGSFISYNFNPNVTYSNITVTNGTILEGNFSLMVDDYLNTYIRLNASNSIINFTIATNFSYTFSNYYALGFNRTTILGLWLKSLKYELSEDANLTIKIKDFDTGIWKNVTNKYQINKSQTIEEIEYRYINENLNFIDFNNASLIQFIFERSDTSEYNITLREFEFQSTYAFDLPISNETYVALEFDLKGENSTVNGFYAWIRALNVTEAAHAHLNITLYRANSTVARTKNIIETESNLENTPLSPDYNDMIDSILVNYTGDKHQYFNFTISNTTNLNVSNYFIVIKSNSSKVIYSLVTLPDNEYGDITCDHQLITTVNEGVNWEKAIHSVYPSGELDASLFKLNVTRGYMPSDFINGSDTLNIENIAIINRWVSTSPYNESSFLEWGLGQWNYNFITPIEDTPFNDFQINLNWTISNITSFKFNVSYSVNAFWVENVTPTYSVIYDEDPEWLYNYTLDTTEPKFYNWSFIEFWFLFPNYMNATSLTNPNMVQILNATGGQSILVENPSKHKIRINNILANNGSHILNLISFNTIKDMHSYINFNGNLWETGGFMRGDNISVSVDIQDQNSKAPMNGIANVTLFDPNGIKFPNATLSNSTGRIENSTLIYDFNNQTVLNLTNPIAILGEYHLGFFWFNGTAIGAKKIIISIDRYDLDLYDCNYDPNLKRNILNGEIINNVFGNYTLLVASVNETTGIYQPNFYPINNTDINEQFNHTIGDDELPVLIKSFKQRKNILNPGEYVDIKTSIQNLHPFISANVKIEVKIVSLANEEWIIANKTSDSVPLDFFGAPGDTNEFTVSLWIPNIGAGIWEGVNAPIRLAGAKTIVTVFVENTDVGSYEPSDYSLLSKKRSNIYEGHILGLKIAENVDSRSILYEFLREECIYLPNKSSFIVNIFDENYISSYEEFEHEFSLKINSKFTNITINPNNPIKGQSFNASAILSTEFGDILNNKSVSLDYYYNTSWINIESDFTDSNGTIMFLINTLTIEFEGDLLIRLWWEENNTNGISENISVPIIYESNNISINIRNNDVQVYRNTDTTFAIILNNLGDSNLRITNISIELNHNLQYSIVEIDYMFQNWLKPGETTSLIVEVKITEIKTLEINITLAAQNILTTENITISKGLEIRIFKPPVTDFLMEYFNVIIISLFALIWVTTILYSRRTIKRIEAPIEETIKKRARRGRYVPVSELKKSKPVKQVPKKQEKLKDQEPKKSIDLDSLLEDKGLVDKKKKSKKLKK